MNKNYKIIQLKKDDTALINQLLDTAAEIHNRKRDSIEWFTWKYFDSPFGESICLLAINNNVIAGEVTFGKYEFILNEKPLNCLISYQTMVHPEHQKKGLFSMLTKEIIKIAKDESIDLIFNFPNKASYTPFEKLNFTPINHLKNYIFIANKFHFTINFLSIKKPFFATSVNEINAENNSVFNHLKETISPLKIADTLIPSRTPSFLKWRYFTQPLYDYKIIETDLGWAIVRNGKRGNLNETQIMECFPNNRFSNSYVKELKQQIKRELKPDLILMNVSENHPINNSLKSAGFISLPHNISFFTFSLNKKFEKYSTNKNWIITATEFHRY